MVSGRPLPHAPPAAWRHAPRPKGKAFTQILGSGHRPRKHRGASRPPQTAAAPLEAPRRLRWVSPILRKGILAYVPAAGLDQWRFFVAGAVTLGDVAAAAGVSLATASRSLHGSADRTVQEELRQRVLAAAERLHYSPNLQAQAVARGRTSVVGLVVQDISDAYFSAIASGVIDAADANDLFVTLVTTHRDPGRELEYVRMLRSQRARAIVLAGSRVNDRTMLRALENEIGLYTAAGGRAVLISQQRLPLDTVLVQNRAGARDLATAVHGLGHRRFAVLAGPTNLVTSTDRLTGFRDGLKRLGTSLTGDDVLRTEFTRDGGYMAMSRLIESGTDATCVFAVNDVMAVGAMAALRDHGVALPEGMAVVGFDDIAPLRDVTPRLTTVRLPLKQLGIDAMELTLSAPADGPRTRRVSGEVVLRESTSAPPRPGPLR